MKICGVNLNCFSVSSSDSENIDALRILRMPISVDLSVDEIRDLKNKKQECLHELINSMPFYKRLDLKNINLSGADLREADLKEADLREAYLREADLRGADLREADLREADLRGDDLRDAYLTGADLRGADLTGADLRGADLRGADLREADLRGADLRGADLRGAYLREADLTGAYLRDAYLTGAYLRGVNLSGAYLREADLRGVDLREVYLTGAYLRGADLRGADLREADLRGADLREAYLREADLRGADLTGVNIFNSNFKDANLDNTNISAVRFPSVWSENRLDIWLNQINNERTFLHILASIDNKYCDKKIVLTHQLINSLDNSSLSVSFSRVAESLLNEFCKPFYLSDEKISTWIENRIYPDYLQKYNVTALPKQTEDVVVALLANFEKNPEKAFTYNAVFNQLILQTMSSNIYDKKKVEIIYDTYLANNRIAKYVKENDDFGVYGEYKVDWSDSDANNFILLSVGNDRDLAIMLSLVQFQKMLGINSNNEMNWNAFFLYQKDKEHNLSPSAYQFGTLFRDDFKIFSSHYDFENKRKSFSKLLHTLELGQYHHAFQKAIESRFTETKFVDMEKQLELSSIFSPKLTEYFDNNLASYRLNKIYLNKLLEAYDLLESDKNAQAETLLGLATVFAKYSSSSIFGTENESPNALRHFAFALMNEAYLLSDKTCPTSHEFNDWRDRLLGNNEAFTCTAVLSNIMVEYMQNKYPTALTKIMPPAWT